MQLAIQKYIQQLIEDLSIFNAKDVLVNVSSNGLQLDHFNDEDIEIRENQNFLKLYRKSKAHFKESGIQTLYLAKGVIKIYNLSVNAPILLNPISVEKKFDRFTLKVDRENAIINPFLIAFLKKEEIIQSDYEGQKSEFCSFLRQLEIGKIDEDILIIDNFHHHRYAIIKELENLLLTESYNPSLLNLIEGDKYQAEFKLQLGKETIFPTDTYQQELFRKIELENVVLKGPPGTGKSQVITNLISKVLFEGLPLLVISEKRAALEVIVQKLIERELHHFAFITSNETNPNDFIQSLLLTWNFIENNQDHFQNNLLLSEELKKHLQIQLDLLNKPNLIGGISFDRYQSISQNIDFSNAIFHPNTPSILSWEKDENKLRTIFKNDWWQLLRFLPKSIFDSENILSLNKRIIAFKNDINLLSNDFTIKSISDINSLMKQAAVCQVIENEKTKNYYEVLIPKSKFEKKFNQLKKKFYKLEKTFLEIEDTLLNWREIPSIAEASWLKENIEKGGFISKRKAVKRFKQLSKIHPSNAPLILNEIIRYHQLKVKFSRLEIDFYEIGIKNPKLDISIIETTKQQIKDFEWEIYFNLKEEEQNKLIKTHSILQRIKSSIKYHFVLDDEDRIDDFLTALTNHFEAVYKEQKLIENLDEESYNFIKKVCSIDEYERSVYYSNFLHFERLFPEFSKFDYTNFNQQLEQITETENTEFENFAQSIIFKIYERFQEYHFIISQPNYKLSEDQKVLKKKLKQGKAILVKEFSKTRQHKSIRELLESDAAYWIKLIKPIWLSSPAQLATSLPLNQNEFDLVIFDEASQIPIANALGAIQRGKRVVIAGDEQQMGPSQLFKSNKETVDLLHQASFYWNKVQLKNHYRSNHSKLIQFSNQHFYDNKLIPYPNFPVIEKPIEFHFIGDGIYANNCNLKEAQKVVKIIESHLLSDEKLGIVAFSKAQLQTIWNELSISSQEKLQNRIDNNSAFFKSLESIQGDECDILVISFGYGYNNEGKFLKQFGPLNQQGGNKRINVLFSRAKSKIHFFSSVQSTDFGITDNETIRLLKNYIQHIEANDSFDIIKFPHYLKPTIENNQLTFSKIASKIKHSNDLVNFYRVLKSKGWEIRFR